MRRLFLFIGVVIALAACMLIAKLTLPQPSLAEDTAARPPVTVGRGSVISTIKATGHLEPRAQVELGFETGGAVTEVLVRQGQKVQAGDPLVRLDTTDLELALKQAVVGVSKAQANMAKVKIPANADDIKNARAVLTAAQAAYEVLVAGPNKDEVTAAAADIRKAEVELQKAQAAYDQVSWKGGVGASSQAADLETATIAYQTALANYNIANQAPTDDKVKDAKAKIVSAQTTLSNLLRGATTEDIAVAQIDIDSAQLALESAKRDLARAVLTAPWTGTITDVNVEVGQRPGTAAILTLADLSELHVNVPVDEIDLPSVRMGQSASVALDALSGRPLSGKVTAIAPAPQDSTDNAVTYLVTVTLEKQNDEVATGMTSKVDVETERRDQVVVIPANLVQVDVGGAPYVEKLGSDGKPVRTSVTLGLRSGDVIEVREGLQEGAEVLPPLPQLGQQSTARQSGGMFPGMGRPPGGAGGPPGGFGGGGGSRPAGSTGR